MEYAIALVALAGFGFFVGMVLSLRPPFSRHKRLALPLISANAGGAVFCIAYFAYLDPPSWNPSLNALFIIGLIVTAGLMVWGAFLSNRWSKDFDVAADILKHGGNFDSEFQARLQRKALNAPLVYSVISFANWCLASLILGGARFLAAVPGESMDATIWAVFRMVFGIVFSGVATVGFVFFYSDYALREFRPLVFPHGGLTRLKGVFRLSVRRRLIAGFTMVSIGPMFLVGVLVYHKATSLAAVDPDKLVSALVLVIFVVLAGIIGMSLVIIRLCSLSIANPVSEMEQAMSRVQNGDLTQKVPVRNNDELGELAESFNLMIDGLAERQRLQRSMNLAMEVQQNLLPKTAPHIDGLDMAGVSRYCDETGGDYFDYLPVPDGRDKAVRLVVADVADHGIHAALLMTTARAFLRQRAETENDPAGIINGVNRHLCPDVEESGGFMTLFLAEIDLNSMTVCWVRAGHQPGWLYDPATNQFSDLAGPGLPLGLIDDFRYQTSETRIAPGQLIILATDGIWEAMDIKGRQFGKGAFQDLIRTHAHRPAKEIVALVLDEVMRFVQPAGLTDDATLMVVRVG